MPVGRYTVLDGEGNAVGTEDFRCAPGPMGWRYFAEIETSDPTPHREMVDLVVDASWRPVRTRIETGSHEMQLSAEGDELRGSLDGRPVKTRWGAEWHLDYLSPAFNAVTTKRLDSSAEIDVIYLEPVTCQTHEERQRYERIGDDDVETPVGTFAASRWRFTALSTGWSRDVWVAGDVVVRFDTLYELEWYEPGETGPRPLA
jgi:hypothetical protein